MNKDLLKVIVFFGLFALPFIPFLVSSSLFFPFITTKAFVFRVVVEIIFAAWAVLALMEPEYRPKKSLVLYSLGAFLLIIGLANIFGAAPVKSFWSNYERMEGYITLLHLGAFFLVISSVFREIDWKRWWTTSLVASFLMIIYCAFQLAGSLEIHQGGARVDGTLGNASYLAVYMLFHIFVAMFFAWREKGGVRWTYGFLILLQLWILYHTATRGAILGLIGALIVTALLSLRSQVRWVKKSATILLSILLIVVGGFFALRNSAWVMNSPVLSRFASISTEELKSGGRAFVWPMAIEGIKERPILGWGQDNFNYVFNEHYNPAMFRLEPWFDRAHNIFLDWGIAGGVLGLLAYLSLYATLLYLIWRRSDFSYEERSILTGLVLAYFFHNFFVFDQLISYILFFSLLAYAHTRSTSQVAKAGKPVENIEILYAPIVALLLIVALYFGNFRPLQANSTLIQALQASNSGKFADAAKNLEKAYNLSRLGRPETVEQIASQTTGILSSNLSVEEKNKFFAFAKSAVVNQVNELPDDARYALIAGAFFSQTGSLEDALQYLNRAKELIPGKQQVYFELGSAYFNQNNSTLGLATFKEAYDLAPENDEAKLIYLIGSIYAGDLPTEAKLRNEIPENAFVFDNRVVSAYYNAKRMADVRKILERRIELDPANAENYRNALNSLSK